MTDRERMLIVQASDQIDVCEVDTAVNLARSLNMSVCVEDVAGLDELLTASYQHSPQTFDVVYLCGHANETHFGGDGSPHDRDVAIPWPLVSASICELMRPGSLIFLAACKGGRDEVAYDLFLGCDQLHSVVGPAKNVDGPSLLLAFHTMLYQRRVQDAAAEASALLAALVSDQSIACWDATTVAASATFAAYEGSGFDAKYKPVLASMTPDEQAQAGAVFPDWAQLFTLVGSP